MSKPGAWLRVDSLEMAGVGNATADVAGSFVVVGGDDAMVRGLGTAPGTLRIHGSIAHSAADALAAGATVHVHTGTLDDPRFVAFGLATKDDEFAFLGDCAYRQLTEPIGQRLGADAAARLASLVGADSATLRAALVPEYAHASQPPLLNPEVTAPEALAKLRSGLFSLTDLPESWRGDYTLCTHIEPGWADCVDLSTPSSATISVNYYFEPEHPDVEVWLLDAAANTARPLVRLATIHLAHLATRDGVDLTKPGVNVAITLAADPSLADVLADPGKATDAVTQVRLFDDA